MEYNTAKNKQAIIDNLANYDGEIRSTCKALNIKEGTVFTWMERDANFKSQLEEERKRIEGTRTASDKEMIEHTITATDDLYQKKLDSLKDILFRAGLRADTLTPLLEATARAQAVEEMTYKRVISSGGDKQQTRIYLEAAKVANNLLEQCGLKVEAKALKMEPIETFDKVMFMLHYSDDPEIRAIVEEEATRIAEQKLHKTLASDTRKRKNLKC